MVGGNNETTSFVYQGLGKVFSSSTIRIKICNLFRTKSGGMVLKGSVLSSIKSHADDYMEVFTCKHVFHTSTSLLAHYGNILAASYKAPNNGLTSMCRDRK